MSPLRNRIIFHLLAFVLLAAAPWPLAGATPNIVVVVADDLGFDDLGIHNRIAETPNLDRLAAESVQFENFYVNAQCAPTRAAFLTGRQFFQTGVWGVHGGRDYIHLRETLLPEVFQSQGYRTGMAGKWHSGKSGGYFPWDRGFDEAHMARLYQYNPGMGAALAHNGRVEALDGWAQAALGDRAVEFIEANRDQPFFLYVPFMSTHSFWRAPEHYVQKHRDAGHAEALAIFLGMAEYMDAQVGRILDALEFNGIGDETIVVFFSDNGPIPNGGPHPETGKPMFTRGQDWHKRNPHGLRGGKGQMYENGIRSVLYLKHPGRDYPERIAPVVNVKDLYPTLIELAGLSLPADQLPLAGDSIVPLLEGLEGRRSAIDWEARSHVFASPAPNGTIGSYSKPGPVEHPAVDKQRDAEIFRFDNMNFALRKGDYKYVQMANKDERGLYNIKKDPRERNPIKDRPELEAAMIAELQAWWQAVLDDPYTFEKPLQQIGHSPTGESVVYLTAAKTTLGQTQMGAHFAFGFKEVGDGVELPVRVLESGKYEVYLHYTVRAPARSVFRWRLGEQSTEFRIDEVQKERFESGLFEFHPEKMHRLGTFELEAGISETLRIELIEHKVKRDAIDTLAFLVFKKI